MIIIYYTRVAKPKKKCPEMTSSYREDIAKLTHTNTVKYNHSIGENKVLVKSIPVYKSLDLPSV